MHLFVSGLYCIVKRNSNPKFISISTPLRVPIWIVFLFSKVLSLVFVIIEKGILFTPFYRPIASKNLLFALSIFASFATISFFSPRIGFNFVFTKSNFSGCANTNIIASSGVYF